MAYKAKVDFLWYKKKEPVLESDLGHVVEWAKLGLIESCEVPKKVEEKKKELNLDLNGDGVFDKKDKSIAAKVLRKKKK